MLEEGNMIMHKYKAASCFRFLSDPHIKTGVIKSPIPSSDPDSAGEESATAIYSRHEAWREAGWDKKTEMKPGFHDDLMTHIFLMFVVFHLRDAGKYNAMSFFLKNISELTDMAAFNRSPYSV